ncbi:hypothetical protein DNTS_006068 [Danionella cerebrum]|uniref:Uncharacterized protein n=1 Tax=Danionella cerebrum TaxID=2873325 RepID=A0A553NLG3_9TELE|nr:hypothetical protein DNTS_006068 [Danionella translucida]
MGPLPSSYQEQHERRQEHLSCMALGTSLDDVDKAQQIPLVSNVDRLKIGVLRLERNGQDMCLNTTQVPEEHVSVQALISYSEQGGHPGLRWGLETQSEMKNEENRGWKGGGGGEYTMRGRSKLTTGFKAGDGCRSDSLWFIRNRCT